MAAPESYDDLIDALALYDAPNTDAMPDVPDLLRAVTSAGAWDDGRLWAAALSQAIAISCAYADVAVEQYGRRASFWDDRGPLRKAWCDAPYTLLPAVFDALVDAAAKKPPQWGDVLRAALRRVAACGTDDLDRVEVALAAAAGLPAEAEARALWAAARPGGLRAVG